MDATDKPDPLPPPTGRTRSLVGRLRARRLALGVSQEELGRRVFDWANRTAERFNESPRWSHPPSKSAISKWEAMFPADPTKPVSEPIRAKRQSFSIFDYACWARALGLRLVVDLVEADGDTEVITLVGDDVAAVHELLGLEPDQRAAILAMIRSLKAR